MYVPCLYFGTDFYHSVVLLLLRGIIFRRILLSSRGVRRHLQFTKAPLYPETYGTCGFNVHIQRLLVSVHRLTRIFFVLGFFSFFFLPGMSQTKLEFYDDDTRSVVKCKDCWSKTVFTFGTDDAVYSAGDLLDPNLPSHEVAVHAGPAQYTSNPGNMSHCRTSGG